MTPENFVYWLQGFMEIAKPTYLDAFQIQEIRNHLALVLDKKTEVIVPNVFEVVGDPPVWNGQICSPQFPYSVEVTCCQSPPIPQDSVFAVMAHHASC
jgi:hypothetical protein